MVEVERRRQPVARGRGAVGDQPPSRLFAEPGQLAGQLERQRLAVARPARQVRLAMVGPGVNDRPLQPAELEHAAVEDEPIARNQPLGVRRLERADRHAAVHDPRRLLGMNRAHVAAEPAGRPPAADAEPALALPDSRRSPARAAPGSGSNAPAGAARSPASEARQASKSARVSSAIGPGLAKEVEDLVGVLFARAGHADELLADDVERSADHAQRLDAAGQGGLGRDDRTGELGGSRREQEAARARAATMARPPDPLHAPRHAAGQPDLDRHVGRADIDTQLEARAGDDRPEHTGPQRAVSISPTPLGIERRVMRGHDTGPPRCRPRTPAASRA